MANKIKTYHLKWIFALGLVWLLSYQAISATTIYLIRHAEKQAGDNPALTEQGHQRAERIAQILKHAEIKAIYSSEYQRTQQTAKPIADSHNLNVKIYDANKLEQFSEQVIQRNENSVIVGHSNTTPKLTELLSNMTIEPMSEAEFGLIYQVIWTQNGADSTPLLEILSSDDK